MEEKFFDKIEMDLEESFERMTEGEHLKLIIL